MSFFLFLRPSLVSIVSRGARSIAKFHYARINAVWLHFWPVKNSTSTNESVSIFVRAKTKSYSNQKQRALACISFLALLNSVQTDLNWFLFSVDEFTLNTFESERKVLRSIGMFCGWNVKRWIFNYLLTFKGVVGLTFQLIFLWMLSDKGDNEKYVIKCIKTNVVKESSHWSGND